LSSISIHIVSFDVPFPADYGGAIDVYFRVKALHDLGVKVTLHCYEYGRGQVKKLEEITEAIHYYPRKKHLFDWFSKRPFIVQTRRSKELVTRLLEDNSPILFEGLHTTFWLDDQRLKDRLKIVRTHNVEHNYYRHLAANASGFKAMFFRSEAKKLELFEAILNHADHVLAINENDVRHFKHYKPEVTLLPPSIDKISLSSQISTKLYCLFHGNLSVSENSLSAKWLINSVFNSGEMRLIVAGKNPSSDLLELQNETIEIISNPSDEEMNNLISMARVHVLHTDQSTGVKLKLIQSLQTSGHVIVNPKMVEGTQLNDYCSVVNSIDDWKNKISTGLNSELSSDDFERRLDLFKNELNTLKNCEKVLLKII